MRICRYVFGRANGAIGVGILHEGQSARCVRKGKLEARLVLQILPHSRLFGCAFFVENACFVIVVNCLRQNRSIRRLTAASQVFFVLTIVVFQIMTLVWFQGIEFIFKSPLGSHGFLTSRCCVLDDRWKLKISEYGLSEVKGVTKAHAKGMPLN